MRYLCIQNYTALRTFNNNLYKVTNNKKQRRDINNGAIFQTDEKLLISKPVAKCANTYYEMSTFKKELFSYLWTLNDKKSICKKIKEKKKNRHYQ